MLGTAVSLSRTTRIKGWDYPMRTHEPGEFLSKLSTNELPDPTQVAIIGLVKADEGSSSAIGFTRSLLCEKWLSLPIEIVESITHLANIACKDHEHLLVRVKFKRPDEGRRDLAFFLSLWSQREASLSHSRRVTPTRFTFRTLISDCAVVHTPEGLEVCCWIDHPDGTYEIECTGVV